MSFLIHYCLSLITTKSGARRRKLVQRIFILFRKPTTVFSSSDQLKNLEYSVNVKVYTYAYSTDNLKLLLYNKMLDILQEISERGYKQTSDIVVNTAEIRL